MSYMQKTVQLSMKAELSGNGQIDRIIMLRVKDYGLGLEDRFKGNRWKFF